MFISFEGIDGSGKSTQATALTQVLRDQGYDVLLVREPGGTPIGEQMRATLRESSDISAEAELGLYLAARGELVKKLISPALELGKIVIADRYSDSTIAYQGFGRGLNTVRVEYACQLFTGGLTPDLTFFMDVRPPQALARKHGMRASARCRGLVRQEAVQASPVRRDASGDDAAGRDVRDDQLGRRRRTVRGPRPVGEGRERDCDGRRGYRPSEQLQPTAGGPGSYG